MIDVYNWTFSATLNNKTTCQDEHLKCIMFICYKSFLNVFDTIIIIYYRAKNVLIRINKNKNILNIR